ncbi:MAG: hypothetical protein J0H74_07200 [Chitinophagaceae bacterium]|nr:hypothetical protein [Chitinophagaceae bacterium]
MKLLTMITTAGTLFILNMAPVTAQKKVSELTLAYDYSVGDGKPSQGSENATHTVYIKGNKSRSEIASALFSSTVIYDANTGFGVILKEVSGQKLLIRLNPDNWKERNRLYDGVVYKSTGEAREIAGYKCQKATGQTKSGATITVFYTKDLLVENKEWDPAFHGLDGIPLEYEFNQGPIQIKYRISRVSLNPIPASKFDIPKSGYREMSYEESKKTNIGG